MLSMKQASKSRRALLSPPSLFDNTSIISTPSSPLPSSPSSSYNPTHSVFLYYCYCFFCHYSTASAIPIQQFNFNPSCSAHEVVVQSFKQWFTRRDSGFLDRIFEILREKDEVDELALSQLGLRLSESLVLEVLKHGRDQDEILSCLKFFDWAGRQPGFAHTRATYHAIFKILKRAKLTPLMLEFLDNYTSVSIFNHRLGFGFYATLVMGYSVVGKPQFALQLFGRMRFQGNDLDARTYHVLLNSLVEEGCFDAVKEIAKQISLRGFECHVTHSVLVKSLCKQKMLEEAELHLRRVLLVGNAYRHGGAVAILVDALCQKGQFEKAGRVIEDFRELGVEPMVPAYGVWLSNLIRAGKLDGALEFLQRKKSSESYVPEVFRYNVLLCRLLKENRLTEACDLLMDMMEGGIFPDTVTMNTALCFFCKAGMVNVALHFYNCKSEFGLSPSTMACNYLINSLCGEGNIEEALSVLKDVAEQGYFPVKRTFSILVDALYREGKLDMMKELVFVALERNLMPKDFEYDKFISVLCKARMLEDGYLLYWELDRINKVARRSTYSNLIYGFIKFNKVDIAASLLIQMQQKGHMATRRLFRAVICSLCNMENPETKFFRLLEMHLSHHEPNCQLYNYYIDGAGHAKKPELAREVFNLMQRSGIEPNLSSNILMLLSYLKSGRIFDALNFFDYLRQRREIGRKLYNTMIVGLCKANKVDTALTYLAEMRSNRVDPSDECYEVLMQWLCSNKQYDNVVDFIKNLEREGRHVTSFMGNVLLLNSLRSEDLFDAWIRATEVEHEISSNLSLLGQLIGAFSGPVIVSQQNDNLEEVIKKCFPLDLYTYNMLLRRLSISKIDDALELFDRLCKKGFEPNRWTYDALVHGLLKHGRREEARRWMVEMFKKGFDPTYCTERLIYYISRHSEFYKFLPEKGYA